MPSLSLVIPAFNESKRIGDSLQAVARYLREAPVAPVEVIVVDDGSDDGCGEIARMQKATLEKAGASLHVVRNPGNRGKGYSVRRGMREAHYEWILFSDADFSAPIGELDKLLRIATEGGQDVAIGSRALDPSLIGVHQPLYRELLGRLFNLYTRALTGLKIADTQCGFKLYSRQAAWQIAAKQRIERFGFDVEQLYLARKMGFKIAEVPVHWDNAADSSVGLASGLQAFLDIARVKWNDLTGHYS